MAVQNLTVAPIAILLLGAALQLLLSRVLSGAAKGWLAVGATLAATAAVAVLWPTVYHGHVLHQRLGGWDGPVTLDFRVDGLSLLFAVMATAIGAAILLYSVAYMARDAAATRFYLIMQVFVAGLVLLVFAGDLLLMYAGWELVGLCSFLLVGFWYTDPEAASGARKVLVMTHGAGYALLAAILVLYARAGTTLWSDPRVSKAFSTGIFALMLVSATAKSVQFPLHTWIPSAMAAPTPVSALLHAAVYVKAGVYLVARMHSLAPWPFAWRASVVWLGTATMLIGVLFAMVQHDAKRLLAFHTVSQIGYMMLGLGLGTPLGIAAALLHTVNHGLFKGGLFLGAGAVQHATGTRDLNRLGGLGRRMPTTTAWWLICAAGIAGVPLFNGFVSKWLLYVAALQSGFAVPALIAWVVSVLTMFSFLKATSAMFFGADGEASQAAHESPRVMLVGSGLLAAGCLLLGVAPQLGLRYLIAPAVSGLGRAVAPVTAVGWFGFSATGGAFVAGGLALAVVSLLAGAGAYRALSRRPALPATAAARTTVAWAPRELVSVGPASAALPPVGLPALVAAPGSPFTGGEPLRPNGYPHADDFSLPVARGLAPFYAWADPDRYYRAAWHGLLRACAAAGRFSRRLERRPLPAVAVLALLTAAVAGLAAGSSRITTTAVAGPAASDASIPAGPLAVTIAVALGCLLLVLLAAGPLRRHAWLAAAAGGLATAGAAVTAELTRVALLEAAAVLAVVLLVRVGVPARARNAYLGAVALSAIALLAGALLLDRAPAGLVLALLLTGFAVKFALVPAYVWLPAMAEQVPAALLGLVVAVVDLAGFAELIGLRSRDAWLFAPTWPWVALALASVLVGGLLALAQTDLKRLLAFASVTASGFVVLGPALGAPFGPAGAAATAAADALALALLFTAVAAVEADGPTLTLQARGVARAHPLAAAGFAAGSLTALGVPFTAGFAGHWRLYAAGWHAGGAVLAVLITGTLLLLLCYARALALVWWGSPDGEPPLPHERRGVHSLRASEPAPVAAAVTVLLLAIVLVGILPGLLIGGGVR